MTEPPMTQRRWILEIMLALGKEPHRFNELMRGIQGISDRVLTERLRDLEKARLVERIVVAERPVRVWYRLTTKGEGFVEPLAEIAVMQSTL